MKYIVILKWNYFNKPCSHQYVFYADNFKDFKQEFLKRFGNLTCVHNSAYKEKSKIKQITYEAKDINTWAHDINIKCDYFDLVVTCSER